MPPLKHGSKLVHQQTHISAAANLTDPSHRRRTDRIRRPACAPPAASARSPLPPPPRPARSRLGRPAAAGAPVRRPRAGAGRTPPSRRPAAAGAPCGPARRAAGPRHQPRRAAALPAARAALPPPPAYAARRKTLPETKVTVSAQRVSYHKTT